MARLIVTTREGETRTVEGQAGHSVMELIRDAGFDELLALCGGCCSCATCHVHVEANWLGRLAPMSADEDDLLDSSSDRDVREDKGKRGLDVMHWNVFHCAASWPMTNVKNLTLPQWRKLAEQPANRCVVPLTEFCEWTPNRIDPGDGKPLKGEMWFAVDNQPIFTVAGFWQQMGSGERMVENVRSHDCHPRRWPSLFLRWPQDQRSH